MQIVLVLFFAFMIEMFFQLIKYQDSSSPNSLDVSTGDSSPTIYRSVFRFVESGNKNRWVTYATFRFIPPLIVFVLFATVVQKYFAEDNLMALIILTCILSLIPRDFIQLFKRRVMISEKIIHIVNIIILIMMAIIVGLVADFVDMRCLAPSLEGVVDSLWAALFTSLLIVLYIRVSTTPDRRSSSSRDAELSNMVVRLYHRVRKLYHQNIMYECNINNTSVPLLYAILVYEDMNRPAWLRRAENIIVKLTKRELTVGIAQVKSRKPLTDIESIHKAAKVLSGTCELSREFQQGEYNSSQLQDAINKYNKSPQYSDEIAVILCNLHAYTNEVFDEINDIVVEDIIEEKNK